MTIAWQEPLDNGGTNITGYVVHYRPVDQESWSPVTACTAKRRYKVKKEIILIKTKIKTHFVSTGNKTKTSTNILFQSSS